MRGVLGLAVELWTFGSPGGLQILTFSKCWASPPHLAKVGLRQWFWWKMWLQQQLVIDSYKHNLTLYFQKPLMKGFEHNCLSYTPSWWATKLLWKRYNLTNFLHPINRLYKFYFIIYLFLLINLTFFLKLLEYYLCWI
jgi:hypothetical protein